MKVVNQDWAIDIVPILSCCFSCHFGGKLALALKVGVCQQPFFVFYICSKPKYSMHSFRASSGPLLAQFFKIIEFMVCTVVSCLALLCCQDVPP